MGADKSGGEVTRRDFVKGTLVGSGAALLTMPAPLYGMTKSRPIHAWNGYAGEGDYALANGNTESIRSAAHLIRDGKVDELLESVVDTGESYDLIVVGGGFAGLSAVRTFLREAGPGQTCLLLENHALPGGEAKRNEFVVDGYRISGPQGSNLSVVPWEKGGWYDQLWHELGIPRDPEFQKLSGHKGELRISPTNYMPMFGIAEQTANAGYFFDKHTFGLKESYWDMDSSQNAYANTPFSTKEKSDLERLYHGDGRDTAGENWEQWLDGITYKQYLGEVLDIEPRVIEWLDKTLSTTGGLGCDAVSAKFAMIAGSPGFDKGFGGPSLYRFSPDDTEAAGVFAFPGGNDAVYRLMLKSVLPDVIAGGDTFEEIHDGDYRFDRFDRPGSRVRMRLNATAVQVEHDGEPERSTGVTVTYKKEGKVYRVRGRGLVSSVGGWVNKHIVKDLPDAYVQAFGELIHGSNMIINVALRNWKPMAELGISACHFFSDRGLGGYCNIKRPMIFGNNQSPLDPAKPAVLTFYAGFPKPGLPAREQAAAIRWELLSKSYADIEGAVRDQLTEMFGPLGFNADRDIAGITLNRWGHSYIASTPGFFYGKDGKPAPQSVITSRFGRIAFGHSENKGIQEWFGAVEHGERAARQVMEVL
jgi:spermidine dehydrogenase